MRTFFTILALSATVAMASTPSFARLHSVYTDRVVASFGSSAGGENYDALIEVTGDENISGADFGRWRLAKAADTCAPFPHIQLLFGLSVTTDLSPSLRLLAAQADINGNLVIDGTDFGYLRTHCRA